ALPRGAGAPPGELAPGVPPGRRGVHDAGGRARPARLAPRRPRGGGGAEGALKPRGPVRFRGPLPPRAAGERVWGTSAELLCPDPCRLGRQVNEFGELESS